MRTIWYMGAKTRLTGEIQAAVRRAAPRGEAVLDLMSGTAVVATALAADYRVVANDVQAYAGAIARAYLEHGRGKAALLRGLDPAADLEAAYRENEAALLDALGEAVALEDAFLEAYGLTPEAPDPAAGPLFGSPSGGAALRRARRRVPADPAARARAYRAFALGGTPLLLEDGDAACGGAFRPAADLFRRATVAARREDPGLGPYLLASVYYPNVYLGIRQAIQIDCLRYAIDRLPGRGRRAARRRAHYLAALLHATSVTTSATSHFCQPRGLVRDAEVKAVLVRRATSIPSRLAAFSAAIAETVARTPHRPGNAVHAGDWRDLYARWDEDVAADVVYADPPYTADNYSRFYHVLEVLTRYDYPPLQRGGRTKGRYPAIGRRHQSPFCQRTRVEAELADLCRETAARGAGLVLSYGLENGLLLRRYRDEGLAPEAALRRFGDLARAAYRRVEVERRTLLHSGQGDSNHQVTELLLVARDPRRRPRCG